MAQRSGIPQYFLYGESLQDVDEHFLHVESIAARSQLHDWRIAPHAHRDLHHTLLIVRGDGMFHAEGNASAFKAPALIAVPPACVHSFDFRPGTEGWIVTAARGLLGRIARHHPELDKVFESAAALALTSAVAKSLRSQFATLEEEFRGLRPGRRAAAEAALIAIEVTVLRLTLDHQPPDLRTRNSDAALVARYRSLVEIQFRKQTGIAEYATQLFASQERLRLACVRTTGSSPLALLNSRRLLEAKRNLLYTNMNVSMIAEACGFTDPAYFSRFFARATGNAPREYRIREDRGHP
jgi:AraC family transcriptional activator of pobA